MRLTGAPVLAACARQVDSDGDTVAFEVLISQLFEFLLTLVGSARLLPLLRPMLPELMYLTLGAPALALLACPAPSLAPSPCMPYLESLFACSNKHGHICFDCHLTQAGRV